MPNTRAPPCLPENPRRQQPALLCAFAHKEFYVLLTVEALHVPLLQVSPQVLGCVPLFLDLLVGSYDPRKILIAIASLAMSATGGDGQDH